MGSSRSTPTSSTVQQVRQEYPAYFQPYLEDVLTGAQQQYEREYEPFPESRLVETPEKRTEALTALQDMDLARMSQGVYNDAIAGTQAAGAGFPDTNLESYMNPYQQLVTDQLLRNATERRGVARKGIGDAAARSGAYGGSRQGVAEAMFDRDTQRELTDLEERSNMAAFQNALAASQADKQRQLASSAQLGQLGQAQQQALTSGIAGVEKAATAEQALAQQARDIALQDFKTQEGFDTQKLAEYSAIIRGATPPANQFIDKTTSTPQSGLQQLGGLASIGAGLFGGMGKAKGGPVGYARGDVVGDVTQDVVTDAIDKLAGIGMGNITMPTPGMDALHAHPAIASTTVDIESISMPEEPDGMGIDSTTGLQALGQPPVDDGFNPDNAVEVTDEMSETMMGNTGGPVGLAYGGVPGQAYTEDIGMMGGLASVAGPQMRFANQGSVPNAYELMKKRPTMARKRIDPAGVTGARPADGEIIEDESFGWWNTEDKKRLRGLDYDPDFDAYRKQLAIDVPRMTDAQAKKMFLKKQKFQDKTKKRVGEFEQSEPFVEKETVDVKEKVTGPDGTSIEDMYTDVEDFSYGPMIPESDAPKKKQPLKQKLPTKNTPSIDMEALRKLNRDPGISRAQLVAAGLALATGRESGLTAASQAIGKGKGTLSDLDVELKGLDASQKNEKNKAALAETLRKRAADRSKRSFEAQKSAREIVKIQSDIAKADTTAAIKIWNGLDFAGKNSMLGLTDEEAIKEAMNNPEMYAAKVRKAIAGLRPGMPV